MAHHFADNVHTKSFTPREYQVELLDAAKDRNIIECLATESGKSFIAMKLIQEMANDTRRAFGRRKDGGRGGKRTLFLVEHKKKACKVSLGLRNLTDLSVSNIWCKEADSRGWSNERWKQELQLHQVLVMSSQMCYFILSHGILNLKYVNLLIMDQCHRAIKDHPYAKIMSEFYKKLPWKKRPRILGLTTPLLLLMGCPVTEKDIPLKAPHPGYLEAHLERLEKILDCTAETASDIVSLLRYCPRPRELVVEWSLAKGIDPEAISLSRNIELELTTAWNFLQDHRYDPMEIYQDAEFAEELSRIPDPKIDPVYVLKDFVHILKTLGPWCADRAALLLLIHLDKLKVKTPYERHFLLLCMVTTIMVKIRRICDLAFQDYDECERIYKFSTPKVLRFLEILKEFLPPVTSTAKDAESHVKSKEGVESVEEREVLKKETPQSNDEKDASVNENSVINATKKLQHNNLNSGEINEGTGKESEEISSKITDLNEGNEDLSAPLNISVGNHNSAGEICRTETNHLSYHEKNTHSAKSKNDLISDHVEECDNEANENATEKGLLGNHNDSQTSVSEPARFSNRESSVWERGFGRGRKWGGYRSRGRGARAGGRVGHTPFNKSGPDLSVSDSLCGIVFVDGRFTAKILYHLLNDLRRSDPQFASLAAQYTVGCTMPLNGDNSSLLDPREIEAEFKKQEEVLKRFRTHECNLLIGPTGWALEDGGLELPRCNLVLRFDHESVSTEIVPLYRNATKSLSESNDEKLEVSVAEVSQSESVSSSEIKLIDENEGKPTEDVVSELESECLRESPSASAEEKDSVCKMLELSEREIPDAILKEENSSGVKDIKEPSSSNENEDGLKAEDSCVVKSVDEIKVEVQEEEQVSSTAEESSISKEAEEVSSNIGQQNDNLPVLLEKVVSRTPVSYHSYARSRARARAPDAHHIIMAAEGEDACRVVESLAHFIQVEEMLLRRCKNREPPEEEEVEADDVALQGEIYCPASISSGALAVKTTQAYTLAKSQQNGTTAKDPAKEDATAEKACVTLATAISLVNRYCAKLPSDTFTRLTPLWSLRKVKGSDGDLSYICALRLPINSPVKQDILGNPMRSKALARRSAALEACKVLHQAKELDDDLMPVGKESFRAEVESDEEDDVEDEEEEDYEDESITENLINKKNDSAEKDLSGKDTCISNNVSESTNDNSSESRLETKGDDSIITEESRNEVESEEIVNDTIPGKLIRIKEHEREKESIEIEKEEKVKKREHEELDLKDILNGEVDGESISPHCICQRSSSKALKGKLEKNLESVARSQTDEVERSGLVTDDTENTIQVLDSIDKESESKSCNNCVIDRNNKNLGKDICDEKNLINLMPVKLPEEEMRPVDKKEMIMRENKLKGCKELKAKNKQQEVEYLEEEGEEEVAVGDGLSGIYGLDRPRPGTTKRRQYYYKRTADALTDCRPQPMFPAYLYNIGMKLVCPLPDEQNTRGRRIHPPEDSPRGFGILTLKEIPKICAFPIFTRSGEVRVCLEPSKPGVTPAKSWANGSMLYSVIEEQKVKALPNGIKEVVLPDPQQILLTGEQLAKALAFLNYTFAGVLRLQRYLMAFDPVASENSYLIVPTMTRKITEKDGDEEGSRETHPNKEWIEVDWDFVDLIYDCKGESKPAPVCEEERKSFQFDASLYHDAVVMPWYRNQDQPQYFYVAEICTHLSPKSSFPGSEYKTFEEYYFKKYAIQICNREQPLLDVDHTSARLNFLTPRYVNRKGVALPTSSEETKRAKRESLEQKQILVPELCCRHPFPASLWRKAVCLPCILYRLNALLLADQLRARVAREIGVGLEKVPEDFEWPPLDFGWSLADVLKRSKEAENQNMESKKGANPGKGEDKNENRKEEKLSEEDDSDDVEGEDRKKAKKKGPKRKKRKKKNGEGSEDERSGDDDDTEDDTSDKNEGEDWMEIGTWSNEMAMQASDVPSLPDNVTMVEEGGRDGWGKGSVGGRGERVRYGSPSIWKGGGAPVEVFSGLENDLEGLETTDSSGDDDDDDAPEDEEGVEEAVLIPEEEVEDRGHHPRGKLRIQFKSDFLAEAVEVMDEDIVVESQLKAVTEAGEEEEENEMTEDEEEESSWPLEEEFETTEKERVEEYIKRFENAVSNNRKMIENSGMLLQSEQKFTLNGKVSKNFETQSLVQITSSSVVSKALPIGGRYSPSNENDKSESAMTNSNTEDFISIDSLSDDEDIFLDAPCSSDDEDDLPAEKVPREGSPCSSSSSFCSCCSSCSSCSSPIWSSEEEAHEMDLEEYSDNYSCDSVEQNQSFSFDAQPTLEGHPGPSPTLLLQALTMSNANDGINLERLETIGDSFLKYAITAYLYCTHHSIHEGKLSHLRSKQVSNVNLYRLGRRKKLGESMIAAKFEPHDNWLPPCYHVPLHLERALIRAGLPPSHWNGAEVPSLASLSPAQIGRVVREKGRRMMMKSISEQDSTQGGSPTIRNSCLPHLNDGNISGSFERSGRIDPQRNLGRNPGAGKKISNLDQELKTKPCDLRSSGNLVSGSEDSNLPSRSTVGDDRMEELPCFVPYNLVTQQSIPDKSVADCVEALIGAYLIACGPRGALLFMAWLGIRVLPSQKAIVLNPRDVCLNEKRERLVGCVAPKDTGGQKGDLQQVVYGALMAPPPPLALSSSAQSTGKEMQRSKEIPKHQGNVCKHCLRVKRKVNTSESGETIGNLTGFDLKKSGSCDKMYDSCTDNVGDGFEVSTSVKKELKVLLGGLNEFEKHIGYYFRDRSLLLQALTHASYSPNRLTDCYQRLEFLGDAVLDYLITRHLYEDPRQHSPGALTDLRSALVNNTIFASLAVRHGFHRFFLHLSPGLHSVVERFVRMQASNGHAICEEYYLIEEEECEEAEDVEVPKALGDVFESVAGAIFLDSGMSLDAVWKVYYRMMKAEIEQFSTNVPKSPIRELLEMEPETAKFGKPEKLADGRRVRVTVEVFGKGTFKGIGRNYRIAKCTAAKCALRQLKKRGLLFPRKN